MKNTINKDAINQIKNITQEEEKIEKKNTLEINNLDDVIKMCFEKKEMKLKYELENNVNLVSFRNKNIEISFNENLNKNFIKNLTSKLLDWTGERWIISLSKKTGLKTMKEIKSQDEDDKLKNLKKSEKYKKAINLFPDLEIIDIKNLE